MIKSQPLGFLPTKDFWAERKKDSKAMSMRAWFAGGAAALSAVFITALGDLGVFWPVRYSAGLALCFVLMNVAAGLLERRLRSVLAAKKP